MIFNAVVLAVATATSIPPVAPIRRAVLGVNCHLSDDIPEPPPKRRGRYSATESGNSPSLFI